MRIHHDLDRREHARPLALAIGFFDGFHLGHREIVRRARSIARLGWSVGVLTFRNHPVAYLRPAQAPSLIAALEERVNRLAQAGVDELFLVPFDDTLAPLTPAEFAQSVLREAMRVSAVVVGENFRFGVNRTGDVAALRAALTPAGIVVEGVPTVSVDGERVSSTRIREALAAGAIELADAMLGRPYALRGRVCLGEGRGHVLGWPTANVEPPPGVTLPKDGVYSGFARLDGREHACLVSVGTKPTFGDGRTERTIEAWLVDFQESVYGREMEISRLRFLRDQVRFDSVEALMAQMERDAQAVRFPTVF